MLLEGRSQNINLYLPMLMRKIKYFQPEIIENENARLL